MGHVEDRWTRPGQPDLNGRARRDKTERYRAGKRWLVSWIDGGKRRARSFDTRERADAFLASVTVDLHAGTYVAPHAVTVAEFGDRWITSQIHQRASTAEQMETRWRLHIRPVLGDYRLTDVNKVGVQAAIGEWLVGHHGREPLAPTTVHVTYAYLAAIFKAAVAERLIRSSPCGDGINLPRVEHERVVPLTTVQVHRIADRITRRYRGMVILGAATGMRSGELRGLTTDRLTWGELLLTVRIDRQLVTTAPTFGPPKTPKSDRVITVDPASAAELRRHMAEFPPHESGLIFTGRERGPLARTSAATAWATATVGMNLPARSGWHQLRHYHASMLIAAGLSVTAVADRLGHQDSSETLATYAHLWPNDEARAMQAIAAGLWGVPGQATVEQTSPNLPAVDDVRSA